MQKRNLTYVHGYLSVANSSTGKWLKQRMGSKFNVLTPEVSGNPVPSLEILNEPGYPPL